MRIYRERSDSYPPSAIYNLYGRQGDFLIAPYSLVLYNGGNQIISSAGDAGPIKQASELVIGNIFNYDLPTNPGSLIKPIVRIAPSINIDFAPVVSIDVAPEVKIGDAVILDVLSGAGTITGTVIDVAKRRPLNQLGGTAAIGYMIGFNTQLQTKYIGARVLLNKAPGNRPLLGMLYDFGNNSRGRVFPCELL
ncbi:MAG: hypothetical protein AAFQ41_03725 [Cyanobacteria bacterium J06623_7]